jgi:sialate O-acetylesterase
MTHRLAFIVPLLLASPSLRAQSTFTVTTLFSDHMVIQRDQAVPIWGSAKPTDDVTVTFATQKKSAKVDPNGKWLIKLDPMPACTEGRDLVIHSSTGNHQAKVSDVVVGDVWLCSGQSNMHFRMASTQHAPAEIAAANNPAVRFFNVEHQFMQKPTDQVSGKWTPISSATAPDCSAVAYYFGAALQRKVGVPIGLLVSSVGGTRIETWMRSEVLADTGEAGDLVEKWAHISPAEFETIGMTYREFQRQRDEVHPQAVRAAKAKGEPVPPAPTVPKQRCHDSPNSLHNGMIAPLQPFALRGAIWYQGESNSAQARPYEKLLPAMIADWRQVWGKDMPFLFVQLAPHRATHPAFREAQHRICDATPHTAMVVTTDVGDAANIHPTRKQPVGERLALAARAQSYGEQIEYSGPVFKSMSIEAERIIVSFTHLGGGLIAKGGELRGFTIASANGKFIPAKAKIEGATVVVTSDKLTRPVAVRYGWAQVPDVNLYNQEGLPAVPFRKGDIPPAP